MMKFKKIVPLLVASVISISAMNITPANVLASKVETTSTTNQQGYTLTWESKPEGKVLSSVGIGKSVYTYTYDDMNKRTSKKSGNIKVSYTYDNDFKLIAETRDKDVWTYQYDLMNEITGFTLNGVSYLYVKDASYNVTAITNSDNTVLAQYVYDNNGLVSSVLGQNPLGEWVDMSSDSSFIGTKNMIRLHSYYFDTETQWYYNGSRYYDSVNNLYVGGTDNLDEISTFEKFMSQNASGDVSASVSQELVVSITNWRNALLSTASFGTPINTWSSTWYSGLSDVELLARLIYGENTYNSADQNAVSWVLINRKNKGTFGSTYRAIATASGQFAPITGGEANSRDARIPKTINSDNSTNSLWASAVWDACVLLSTSNTTDLSSLIPKPTGISGQLYFYGLNYFLTTGVSRDGTSGLEAYVGSWTGIKNIVIVYSNTDVYQNPATQNAIKTQDRLDSYDERATHNIFFDLK